MINKKNIIKIFFILIFIFFSIHNAMAANLIIEKNKYCGLDWDYYNQSLKNIDFKNIKGVIYNLFDLSENIKDLPIGAFGDCRISPDNKKIVFTYINLLKIPLQTRLCVIDFSKSPPVCFFSPYYEQKFINFNEIQPFWSPDGKKICFVSNIFEKRDEIYIWDIETNTVERLTNSIGHKQSPEWSLDGKYIIYQHSTKEQGAEFYLIETYNNNKIRKLTSTSIDETVLDPDWSPDSKKIVYSKKDNKAEDYNIYILNINNPDNIQKINLENFTKTEKYPKFSPDGTKIAFLSNSKTNDITEYKLYVYDLNKQNIIYESEDILINVQHKSGLPFSWLPDSKNIFYISNNEAGDGYNVYNIDVTQPYTSPRQIALILQFKDEILPVEYKFPEQVSGSHELLFSIIARQSSENEKGGYALILGMSNIIGN